MTDARVDWPRDPLAARRDRTPERLALVDAESDRRWTFADLDAFVATLAAGLTETVTAQESTVATLLESRPAALALPLATIRSGAGLAPLNVELDAPTLRDQIDRLNPDVLVCGRDTESLATRVGDVPVASLDRPQSNSVTSLPIDDETGSGCPSGVSSGIDPLESDETALAVFTSGTTGPPKGVGLTVSNLLASATASAFRLGITPRDRWLSPLPPYHVGGLATIFRGTLSGTTTVLQRGFDPEHTKRILDAQQITGVSLVPTALSRLLDTGWRPQDSLRFVLLGGGRAPNSLLDRCIEIGVPVCPTYGATETASQVATATPGTARDHPGTVGRPLAGTTVSIDRTDDGTAFGRDSVGEVVVDGPTVSPGYLDPTATSESFHEDGFHSGDLGWLDEGGRLRIVGRRDDVIVTGGENVQPSGVAGALESHPAVADAAVVGVPDDEWGERVAALVVPTGEIDADGLREHCRERVPRFAVPKTIEFTDALPRTPSGTIDRGAVRTRVGSIEEPT